MRSRSTNYTWLKWLSKWPEKLTVCLFCFCISADWKEDDSFAISLFTDPQVHLAFLTLLSQIDMKMSREAHVLLLASIAHAKLLYGDLEGTKSDMDAA